MPLSAARPSALFATRTTGVALGAEPAADFLVERREALARIDQEQRRVGVAHRGLGLLAHPSGQAMRVLVLEARRVDHPEVEPEQLRLALAPVASHARPVVDQREALADEAVEQGRFADVGPADDGDGRKGHGGGLDEDFRHCEEPQATRQSTRPLDCFAALAMTINDMRAAGLVVVDVERRPRRPPAAG